MVLITYISNVLFGWSLDSRVGRSRNNFCHPNIRHTGWAIMPKYTFKEENATLVGFIFDSADSYWANSFETTIERISDYVTDKYNDGPYICLVVIKLENRALISPSDPIGESRSVLQIWEKEINLHVKWKRQLKFNIWKLYALVIGQCTKALKANLRSLAAYKDTEEWSDAINLIKSIKGVAFKFKSHKNLHIAMSVLNIQITNTLQHDMSLIDYLKSFIQTIRSTNRFKVAYGRIP